VQWQNICSEIALEVANEEVQIHGGNGYVAEYHVERMMRDSKITTYMKELQRFNVSLFQEVWFRKENKIAV
jgi:alkylation response protein AidB-like acyl-CoA dehydrogenase